ncbi:MAG TPA: hypothetical protein VHM90_11235 [Phycisphaerae bacterium]|nr:hypothetical protein [Phycisphaerae bacterium]
MRIRNLATSLLLSACLVLSACTPLEKSARDTAAALNGALTAAQQKYSASCQANTAGQACALINKAIAGQNALITATEAYCGFAPGTVDTATCTPVKSAEPALKSAIANASLFISELKGIL